MEGFTRSRLGLKVSRIQLKCFSEKRSKLNRHLKYIEHRLDEHIKYMEHRQGRERRQERYLFGEDNDHLTRKEALDDSMQHATSLHIKVGVIIRE